MNQFLDAGRDNAIRANLAKPPKVDRTAEIRTAFELNGGHGWIKKYFSCLVGPGKTNLDEFLYFRLYDPDYSAEDSRNFVGKQIQTKAHYQCNNTTWFSASHDKALFYTIAKGAGFLVPKTLAVYSKTARSGFPVTLRDHDQVKSFFENFREFPLFVKPIDGMFSVGAFKIIGSAGNTIQFSEGDEASIDVFCAYMDEISTQGYLFQETIQPSHFNTRHFGTTLSTLRFFVLLGHEPMVESVVVKIPSGRSVADNFWQDGNMLGAVDKDTGEILRVCIGTGSDAREVALHPATGADFDGLKIPDWEGLLQTVKNAAALFPGVKTQSWDIALSKDGPMLVEFNFGGDVNLHQLAHRRGILSENYREHLLANDYKGKI